MAKITLNTTLLGGKKRMDGDANVSNVSYPKPEWVDQYREEIQEYVERVDDLTVSATGLDAGETPTVTKTLVDDHYNFDFGIPKGDKGDTGLTPDISAAVTTLSPGSSATVSVSGTAEEPTITFGIPRGADGQDGRDGVDGKDGADGSDGAAATITVGTVTTGAAGSPASVTNSGTSSAAVFDFVIPKGDKGDPGGGGGSVTDVEVDGVSVVTAGVAEIDLTGKADVSSLADVATSGSYNDLDDTPSLATVATSGSYDDLDDTPTIPTISQEYNASSSSGMSGVAVASAIAGKANSTDLATVATTGSYDDLEDTPSLAAVATSASYNDLINRPTIPTISQTYDGTSTNGMSGTAVASAITGMVVDSGGTSKTLSMSLSGTTLTITYT